MTLSLLASERNEVFAAYHRAKRYRTVAPQQEWPLLEEIEILRDAGAADSNPVNPTSIIVEPDHVPCGCFGQAQELGTRTDSASVEYDASVRAEQSGV
jgi:hypothetical protein